MTNLLQKTLKPHTIFAFIVFLVSIPIYFLLVDWIWLKELDENNELIAQRIENEFNEQKISDEKLNESITFWNDIQSVGKIERIANPLGKDSVYAVRRQNPYTKEVAIDRFRGLITSIQINNKNFMLTIETNVEESEETVAYIAAVVLLFFIILIVGFWILNKWLSQKIWKPFHDTLEKLKTFNLNNQTEIQFLETDIIEFAELNTALDKLLKHNISVFKSQKEFTENASHELQTPLAIIKNKLDLLLQEDSITDRQYQLIEAINRALTRITRINRNLLLLSKIENQQFNNNTQLNFSSILNQCIEQLTEFSADKNIKIKNPIQNNILINGNEVLVEILNNNLLLNAIIHTFENGEIEIKLNEKQLIVTNSGKTALKTKNLFKRFSNNSSETSNSGLGLAIISEICKQHQWEINYSFSNKMHHFTIQF